VQGLHSQDHLLSAIERLHSWATECRMLLVQVEGTVHTQEQGDPAGDVQHRRGGA
jgi:hypothetical protein